MLGPEKPLSAFLITNTPSYLGHASERLDAAMGDAGVIGRRKERWCTNTGEATNTLTKHVCLLGGLPWLAEDHKVKYHKVSLPIKMSQAIRKWESKCQGSAIVKEDKGYFTKRSSKKQGASKDQAIL